MTNNEEYRWRWLSTIIVLLYGLGFPLWVMGSTIYSYTIQLDGTLMSVLVLAWIACFVYAIGPENVREAKKIRSKK